MSEPGPGQTLFEFVRHWSRRTPAADPNGRLVLVTSAVLSLTRRGRVATVNAIAHEIGIDQSGASRLVKTAADGGYLTLLAAETDGRRRHATVSTRGHTLLRDAHDWQERVFHRLTTDWTARQRRDFHRAMLSLIERSHTEDARACPVDHESREHDPRDTP